MDRASGVLLHPTSFPSRFGTGDLGAEAYQFVDWLEAAGQSFWQVLPLNPVDAGDSPYQSPSSFAGNPLLISLEKLVDDGLLTHEQLDQAAIAGAYGCGESNFELAFARKIPLLEQAAQIFKQLPEDHELQVAYRAFCSAQSGWLDQMALFTALKGANEGRSWTTWTHLVDHRHHAGPEAITVLQEPMFLCKFQQFLFFRQWSELRAYARARGILIIGDVPIYVAHDSADVWSNRKMFQLNDSGHATQVAGVPPDYFSATGQLWNNPVYDWHALELDDYRWWARRLRAVIEAVDIVRLDHFRGFEAYWSVPAGHATAEQGMWVVGPRQKLFDALQKQLEIPEGMNRLPIIAEDLGTITPEVDALRLAYGLPGMKVLQFMIAETDPFYPEDFPLESICYSGTHDNDTTVGWFQSHVAPFGDRMERVKRHTSGEVEKIAWDILEVAWKSRSNIAIAPLQDILSLPGTARMNTPGTFGAEARNWVWQYAPGALPLELAQRLRELTVVTNRLLEGKLPQF
jgi:4-alpha-glucanotransferase